MDSPAPFDNFSVRYVAGPFEFDGRWFSEHGEVQVDAANSNLLEITSTNSFHMHVIRRGMRAGKYVATARFKWNASAHPGFVARWIGPSDSAYVAISPADGKARLFLRESGAGTTLSTSGTVLSLTTNNWYTMKLVIGDDLANSALQRLRFWVDTDDDGDWSDETALLDTTTIDDVWSAGHVGLFRGSVSNAQDFDDFKTGIDANADLDIADAGDEVVVDDDFATNVVSTAYDNNGNLTDDGVNKHVYDGWNRHVKSTWRIKSPPSAVVAYEHDGSNRRVSKVVSNSGVENTSNDGGNTTQEYLFANGRLVEERNGSNQLTRAYMWHDNQLVWFEANGDPTIGNDSNPDLTATGEGSEPVADARMYALPGTRGSIQGLSEYVTGGGGANGRVRERQVMITPDLTVLLSSGPSGSELAASAAGSAVGFPFVRRPNRVHPDWTERYDAILEFATHGTEQGFGEGDTSSASNVQSGRALGFQAIQPRTNTVLQSRWSVTSMTSEVEAASLRRATTQSGQFGPEHRIARCCGGIHSDSEFLGCIPSDGQDIRDALVPVVEQRARRHCPDAAECCPIPCASMGCLVTNFIIQCTDDYPNCPYLTQKCVAAYLVVWGCGVEDEGPMGPPELPERGGFVTPRIRLDYWP